MISHHFINKSHYTVIVIRKPSNMFRYALKSSVGASRVTVSAYSRSCAMSTTRYTKSHEYVRMEGDIGTVGITKFAADALGDVVFVDLPSIGTNYTAGDSFGSVESVKAASDVYSPIAGVVVEVNGDLEETPGKVNESPSEHGWFMKIRVGSEGKSSFEKLLDEVAYKKHVEDSAH